MRRLAPSEKRLFLILCGAVFVALNMFGFRAFLQARSGIHKAVLSSKEELAADRRWVEVAETLAAARSWIDAHPMENMPPDEASAALLKSEREEAEKAGLRIVEENLLPVEEGPYGSTAAVSAKLSGPFQGVVKMLFALQTPAAWLSVEKLTLRSDAEPPNVVAEMELKRYFQSGSRQPPSSATATP